MPIQCPNCQAPNRDTATFCSACGTHLTVAASESGLPPAALSRPSTLPESPGSLRTAPPVAPQGSAPAIKPPFLKAGPPPRRHWRLFLGILFISSPIATLMFDPRSAEEFLTLLMIAAIFLAVVLAVPLLRPFFEYRSMGIVTHLREWQPQRARPGSKSTANWVFDLRLTDRNWADLLDRRGFLLPIVEVELRSDRLRGPAIEEGSRVVLRGGIKSDCIEAHQVWNLGPGMAADAAGAAACFWGRVTGLQTRQTPDMRYPGQRSLEVWAFRLQQTDPAFQEMLRDGQANLLPPLPVEIRAQSINGPLQDGDKVELRGTLREGALYAREIYNHSAGRAPIVVKEWAGAP